MQLVFKLVSGERIDQSIESNNFIIGRSAKCDVVIPHEGMSRMHCRIEVIHGEVYVTDLGSTNGVLIDGERITPHVKTQYALYRTLSFGSVQTLQIQFEGVQRFPIQETSAPKVDNARPVAESSNYTVTKTKTLKSVPQGEVQYRAPIRTKKQGSSKNVILCILIVLTISATVWWNIRNKKNQDKVGTVEEKNPYAEEFTP
jgi:pSer/pThr/pTyr-binding forkhead associated (FHA) protein